MSSQRWGRGARVMFKSCADPAVTFIGCIRGFSTDGELAFIQDDRGGNARPVRTRRILGYAIRSDVPRNAA